MIMRAISDATGVANSGNDRDLHARGNAEVKNGPRQHSSAAADSKQHDQCDTEPENFKSVHGASSGFPKNGTEQFANRPEMSQRG